MPDSADHVPPDRAPALAPRAALLLIGLFALAKLLLHLATSSGYGYFRDELYYLACAKHLDAGYVDHPPLCVFLVSLVHHVLGDSRFALRLLPAIAGAATVAIVGLMARALGGGRWALVLAMTAALVAPLYLALDHFYSMNAFDLLFWALAAFLVIRVCDDDAPPREWVWLGLVLGFGLLNKISLLWLGAGLLVGLVATPQRRWLRTPWPWIAGLIAAVLFSPYVIWNAQHGWPTREFIQHASADKMLAVSPLAFLAGQIMSMLPLTFPLWIAGLVFLFVDPAAKTFRVLGWMYVTVFAILVVNGSSRAAYLSPAYTWLFAAGGVAFERWLRTPRAAWIRPAFAATLLAFGAVAAPLALPLLPVEAYIRYARALGQQPSTEERHETAELGQFYADMHGWDDIAATVADVYRRLPPAEAAHARVLAPDYGVAGAIDLLGPRHGIPPDLALSGHNNYWLWGPDGWDGRVLIVIGRPDNEPELRAAFERVDRVATIDCGRCMPYENRRPVWVARHLRLPIGALWARIKHFD